MMRRQGLACICVLAALCALGPCLGRTVAQTLPGPQNTRHRRSLLGATQQISQCDWIAGEGCALHPSYATYALNRTSNDVVAQYVANALACASVVDKGTCEAASQCYWDAAFTNGQQGCFLHESSLLGLQQQCVQQQHLAVLSKLQACSAARRSCQCSGSVSSCQLHQQQLLGSYSSGDSSKVCQSLLGCWLSSLNGSRTDITQLVEVQLVLVQPKLEQLAGAASSSSGRRRALLQQQHLQQHHGSRRQLLQAQQLSLPLLDDTPSSSSSSGGSSSGGELLLESGSLNPATSSPATTHSSSSAAPLIGMNGGVPDEAGTADTSSTISVENANNVPGLSATAGGRSDAGYQDVMESGSLIEWESGTAGATVDPDQVFGSNGTSSSRGGSNGGSSTGGDTSSDGGDSAVQMTGGNAPASFWQCAGEAAVKADQARKWADIDYNSKALTLATWAKVIKPTALVDWGVQVLDCFKSDATVLEQQTSTDLSKPNKESIEFATVALIRSFSAQADVFRTYLQTSGSGRASTGLDGLKRLVQDIFPVQNGALLKKYNSTPSYDRDVMLQAASLIADMQWFSADALALAAGMPVAQQQEVFEGVISYGEEMIRRTLYWLFHLQFAGPPAHLPGVPASTPESNAVVAAFDGLATAALPGPVVAADAPVWQQLQSMVAVAAGWVANAAKLAQALGDKLDALLLTGNTVDGLAKAHINEFWGSRLELARASASEAARSLALQDPNQSAARWAPLRQRQVQLLNLLQQLVMTGSSSDTTGVQVQGLVRDMVADAGSYLLSAGGSNAAGSAATAATQQELAASLQYSSQLAYLIRQCKGSPAGLKPLSAGAAASAGIPATSAAACSQLTAETQKMAAKALAGSDVFVASLVEDLGQQWTCSAQPASGCSSTPGCKLALAATLAPGSSSSSGGASAGSSSPSPAQAELLMEGSAKPEGVYACEAADSTLHVSSMPNNTKTAIAASPACQQFLLLPECEGMAGAATCSGFSACRWELSAQRNLMHTTGAGNQSGISSDAAASIAAASGGVCAMDWVSVLQGVSAGSYSGLAGMISMCRGIRDDASCTAQTMLITLEAQTGGGNNMARIWVPVLVVAAVLGVLLFVGAMYWRRRSTAARRAAEEARSGPHGRGGKKFKEGKEGKVKGKALKKKAKRAEIGSYKPDLMRDSFTDYMRSAPQQFENGVAIAKAAMAAGSLDVGVVVADVAGGHSVQYATPIQQQHYQQAMLPAAGPGSYRSVSAGGVPCLPPLAPAGGSQPLQVVQQQRSASAGGGFVVGSGNDLIDLQTGDGVSMQQQSGAAGMLPFTQVQSGSIWGAAAGTSATGGLSGGVMSGGVSGSLLSGGLSGQVDLIDTGASLALTSSLGLVSSLPQHNSIPFSAVSGASATQSGVPGYGARSPAAGLAAGGHQGGPPGLALPLGARVSEEPEEGATTPTSSCCHDSVCTFRQGPGSSVGVGSRPGSTTSGWRPGGSRAGGRAGSSTSSLASAAAAGGSGLPTALSGALSGGLSRSSWSSAMSTDMLITQQSSAVVYP